MDTKFTKDQYWGEEQTPTKSNVGEDFILSVIIQKVCCEHPVGIVLGDVAVRRRDFFKIYIYIYIVKVRIFGWKTSNFNE